MLKGKFASGSAKRPANRPVIGPVSTRLFVKPTLENVDIQLFNS